MGSRRTQEVASGPPPETRRSSIGCRWRSAGTVPVPNVTAPVRRPAAPHRPTKRTTMTRTRLTQGGYDPFPRTLDDGTTTCPLTDPRRRLRRAARGDGAPHRRRRTVREACPAWDAGLVFPGDGSATTCSDERGGGPEPGHGPATWLPTPPGPHSKPDTDHVPAPPTTSLPLPPSSVPLPSVSSMSAEDVPVVVELR
jgi:hypothetical protein